MLMRGIPGSGKSTLAKALQFKDPKETVICSADDFWFDTHGVYRFDARLLGEAHKKCQKDAEGYMKLGKMQVIVDNCNLAKVHQAPYLELAEKFGYEVQVVTVDTPLNVCMERNARRREDRRVPEGTITRLARQCGLGVNA